MSETQRTSEIANVGALIAHLNGHWQGRGCPLCGGTSWHVNENVFELRSFFRGDLVLGAPSQILPVVAVTCRTCSQVVFVNAIGAGAIEPPKTDSEGQSDG